MNIFVLDKNPRIAAKFLHDVHIRKMIIESCQLLANCYPVEKLQEAPKTQKENVRKHSYYNHPCSIFTRKSIENFNWLLEHAIAISDEYTFRFEKNHFCLEFLRWCCKNKPNLPKLGGVDFVLCMPETHKSDSVVNSYKKYYSKEKTVDKNGKAMDSYTKRKKPLWLKFSSSGIEKVITMSLGGTNWEVCRGIASLEYQTFS